MVIILNITSDRPILAFSAQFRNFLFRSNRLNDLEGLKSNAKHVIAQDLYVKADRQGIVQTAQAGKDAHGYFQQGPGIVRSLRISTRVPGNYGSHAGCVPGLHFRAPPSD